MITYEYRLERLDHGIDHDMPATLTEWGQEGWHVVHTERNGVRWTFLLERMQGSTQTA